MPEQFKIVAVCDANGERAAAAAAELGCRVSRTSETLFAEADVDLVVIASYNNFHKIHTVQALNAGRNVLCDKPFGLTVADVDDMVAAAARAGKLLSPFQQRRYEKDFLKVKEVIDSGVLGDIVHIRTCWHGFKRRWDWQTTRAFAGGALNNNGPHPLDHLMCLFGDAEPTVWAQAGRYLASGDAEDHLKVILSAKGSPTAELELTDVWAYPQDRWNVAGTRGGLRGNESFLEWKYVDFSRMPPRPLCLESTPDRSYNSEKLEWTTGEWKTQTVAAGAGTNPNEGPVHELYLDLHAALTQHKPLRITPEQVRRRIAVMEKIRAAIAAQPCR
jgi:predicted dehydrogenase